MPLGRTEKMVPTEILFSRLADPSSGSIATQNGAVGRRVSGSTASSERTAATAVSRKARRIIRVGRDIDVLLLIAIGIDAAVLSGDADKRPIRDQLGKFGCRGGNGLDHVPKGSAMRRLRRGPIEMRTQRHALVHERLPAPAVGALSQASRRFGDQRL